jgi:3-hydroxybutyrate dehydrogenase
MIRGKSAIVTGSTSGIGLGIAGAFAAQGGDVLLNGFGDPAEIAGIQRSLESKHNVRAASITAAEIAIDNGWTQH